MASRLLVSLVLAFTLFVSPASAQAPVGSPQPHLEALTSTTSIEAYVASKALESGLGKPFYDTLKCESMGWQDIQSLVPHLDSPNDREDSWGVAQIHLPDHPDVNQEEALDVRFAVDFTIKMFKNGQAHQWTCWRNLQK